MFGQQAIWALSLVLGAPQPGSAAEAKRGGLSGEVRAGVQVIAGQSQSPFLVGPDSAPLLNTTILPQAQSTYNLLITPNAQVRWRARGQDYQLNYGPRLFLDLRSPDRAPTVFHILSSKVTLGRPQKVVVELNPSLTIGGLDLGGASAPAGTLFVGATRPGTIGGIPSSYLSANLMGRIDAAWRRGMRLQSTETYSLTRSPLDPPLPSTPQGLPTGGNFLFNMTRFESLNELVVPARSGTWRLQVAPGWTNFPATRSYLSLQPSLAWQRGFGRGGALNARAGLWAARQGYFPGRFDFIEVLAVAEAGVTHDFARIGLPRLKGGVAMVMGPYWDPLFGLVQPRTTVTGNLGYEFNRHISTQLQLRYYTGRYFNFYLAPRHDKDVLITTLTVRGRINRYFSAQVGGYSVNRRRVPSRTDLSAAANDYFVFVGLDGTLLL